MQNNLELWGKVEKTEVTLIKEVKQEGRTLKTIAPINRTKRATEIFGIYGKDWGLKQIKHNEKTIFSSLVIGTVDAVFFYTINDAKIEFEISNSISIVSQVEGKLKVNITYRKAIETDTINKALSRLGFNADLYTDGELLEGENVVNEFDELDLIQIIKDADKGVKND